MKSAAYRKADQLRQSHPARGAWIEIGTVAPERFCSPVAPRKGCVD